MKLIRPLVVTLSLVLLGAPASVLAEKGGKHGKGKDEVRHETRQEYRHEGAQPRDGVRVEFRFGDQDQRVLRDYYGVQVRGGNCPPGLAKKGNGCMPPGQAKKWGVGRPLPRDVVYYDLPPDLIVRMPPPPVGHRYVRVAGDILLIAIGSSMVVDAVQDILR